MSTASLRVRSWPICLASVGEIRDRAQYDDRQGAWPRCLLSADERNTATQEDWIADGGNASDSVIRRRRLNVRCARKRTRLSDLRVRALSSATAPPLRSVARPRPRRPAESEPLAASRRSPTPATVSIAVAGVSPRRKLLLRGRGQKKSIKICGVVSIAAHFSVFDLKSNIQVCKTLRLVGGRGQKNQTSFYF